MLTLDTLGPGRGKGSARNYFKISHVDKPNFAYKMLQKNKGQRKQIV